MNLFQVLRTFSNESNVIALIKRLAFNDTVPQFHQYRISRQRLSNVWIIYLDNLVSIVITSIVAENLYQLQNILNLPWNIYVPTIQCLWWYYIIATFTLVTWSSPRKPWLMCVHSFADHHLSSKSLNLMLSKIDGYQMNPSLHLEWFFSSFAVVKLTTLILNHI